MYQALRTFAAIALLMDPEGFDPERDTVGAGIYGGCVERDESGEIVIGRQYRGHCKGDGPVYNGQGYTLVNQLISQRNHEALTELLTKSPHLANEVSTGGATPLHFCGMSARGQYAVPVLLKLGATTLDTPDTCGGYTPLHRMASNNLPVGAEALLTAGANVHSVSGSGETPLQVAMASRARDVVAVLRRFGAKR